MKSKVSMLSSHCLNTNASQPMLELTYLFCGEPELFKMNSGAEPLESCYWSAVTQYSLTVALKSIYIRVGGLQ